MLRPGHTTDGMTKLEAKMLACVLAWWLAELCAARDIPDEYSDDEQWLLWQEKIRTFKSGYMTEGKQFLLENPDFASGAFLDLYRIVEFGVDAIARVESGASGTLPPSIKMRATSFNPGIKGLGHRIRSWVLYMKYKYTASKWG